MHRFEWNARWVQIAQQLYEGVKLDNEEQMGLITYMRTDGVQVGATWTFTAQSENNEY
jgi:DNA topoisomerase IA